MNNDMPYSRGAQTIPQIIGGQVSDMRSDITNSRELVIGQNRINEPQAPGQIQQARNIPETNWEGIGRIDDVSDLRKKEEDNSEGEGPYVVVLSDYVSGDKGNGFVKGNVRRISKLINGYSAHKNNEDENVGKESIRIGANRLFELKAIRLANGQEIRMGQIDVGFGSDNAREQETNARLIQIEQENARLKMQLQSALDAQQKASPNQNKGQQTEVKTVTDVPKGGPNVPPVEF